MSDKEQFSHYTPQHPLPEEIKKLPRDEKVCKYCGVSYLILNEIKALEERLKAAESELSNLRGYEKRSELLTQENTLLKLQMADLQLSLETSSKLMTTLNVDIESLREQNHILEDSMTSYRKKYMTTLRHLSSLRQTVRQQRQCLQDMREKLTSSKSEISETILACLQSLKLISQSAAKETSDLESRIGCLDMEKLVLTESNKKLTDSLKRKETELLLAESKLKAGMENTCKLENSLREVDTLSHSLKNMEDTLDVTRKQLKDSRSESSMLTVELGQYRTQLRSNTTELNNAMNMKKQEDQAHVVALHKLGLEVRGKENELESCLKQLKNLEYSCQEYQKKEHEIRQQNKLGLNEMQELRDSLQRVKSDNEALKTEREMMIEAHQNRIEDLRESFKNKMSEVDIWPQKLVEAVSAEKARHQAEMRVLEDSLKHNFVLELHVEKDKYNELFKKFQAQENDRTSLRETQQAVLEQAYKHEMEDLQRQVREAKEHGQEMEGDLGKEIRGLKKIINDLQDRLARLDGAESSKLTELNNELFKTKQEKLEADNTVTVLERKLQEAKDENQFLEQVVRKECEERIELTETLSDARLTLLQLTQPLGGYSSTQKGGKISSIYSRNQCLPLQEPGPPKSAPRTRASKVRPKNQCLQSPPQEPVPPKSTPRTSASHSRNQGLQSPPQRPPYPEDPVLKLKSSLPTSSVHLSYNGQAARKNSNGSITTTITDKSTEAEILTSRRRIASMMGRPS